MAGKGPRTEQCNRHIAIISLGEDLVVDEELLFGTRPGQRRKELLDDLDIIPTVAAAVQLRRHPP